MDENLVGYLLNALDPDTHRAVESYLAKTPEAQHHLDLLRRALEPLAADREEIEPPPELVLRTLAGVAEYRCRPLPKAPALAGGRSGAPARRWWQRADLLVAAGIFVAIFGLGLPKLNEYRRQMEVDECANNLRGFHTALVDYSSRNGGRFPNVADHPWPHNVAGMVVPMLHESSPDKAHGLNVRCPGTSTRVRPANWTMEQLKGLDHDRFNEEVAPHLLGDYAYSLGYRDPQDRCRSLPRQGCGQLPIMADRPPHDPQAGNSPNHGGRGQNVLFINGNVRFVEQPTIDGDHIYLNQDEEPGVAAGMHDHDIVLGASDDRPNPESNEEK